MKHFFTISLCFLALSLSAQTDGWEYPFPYNPDGNADGYIALDDLMDFLALYGQEYPDSFYSDTTRAVLNLGEMGISECFYQAEQAGDEWRVMSVYDVNFFGPLVVKTFPDDLDNKYVLLDYPDSPYNSTLTYIHTTNAVIPYSNNFGNNFYFYNSTNLLSQWDNLKLCIVVSEVRPEYEYSYCNAQGGQDGIFKDCIESKLNEGWIPWQGASNNYNSLYQGFWRIKD